MAAQYELASNALLAAGDAQGACMMLRSARLSHESVRRWIRPDGALQIVKNWFLDPAERFGYESYSFFSQYNLLPCAWLALAYSFATPETDALAECPTIADVGGVAFALDDVAFRKVFASASGTFIEVMTGADAEYDATGFGRFHVRAGDGDGLFSLLGPSAAAPISASVPQLPSAVSLGGLFWRLPGDAPGAFRSLANSTLGDVLAAVFTPSALNTPSAVGFSLEYVLWSAGVSGAPDQ